MGHLGARDFGKVIDRHKNVNAYLKNQEAEKGRVMLCLVDDFADAGEKVMHSSNHILTSLFARGRHLGCACWLLTQKLKVVSLICRTFFCWMLIWRLRNSKELMSILEELDALHDRRVLMQMYQIATQDKHGFWYVNLLNDKEQMFFKGFEQRMLVN